MSAEELDLKGLYAKPQPVPTVILQLIDGHLTVYAGPRPMPREEFIYDWDTTWNEPGTEVVAVDVTIQFQKTQSGAIVMVQRCLDEFGLTKEVDIPAGDGRIAATGWLPWEFNDPEGLGQWIWDVLHGKDPR